MTNTAGWIRDGCRLTDSKRFDFGKDYQRGLPVRYWWFNLDADVNGFWNRILFWEQHESDPGSTILPMAIFGSYVSLTIKQTSKLYTRSKTEALSRWHGQNRRCIILQSVSLSSYMYVQCNGRLWQRRVVNGSDGPAGRIRSGQRFAWSGRVQEKWPVDNSVVVISILLKTSLCVMMCPKLYRSKTVSADTDETNAIPSYCLWALDHSSIATIGIISSGCCVQSWLVGCLGFYDSTRDKDDTTVGVGHSRRYCNTGYDQSQGRRPSTLKCIGPISKGDIEPNHPSEINPNSDSRSRSDGRSRRFVQYRVDQSQGQRPKSLLKITTTVQSCLPWFN